MFKERGYIVELKAGSVFAWDDTNLLLWLTFLAFSLVLTTIALAFLAEYKREPTLYSSAGFIVASVGLGLQYPIAMFVIQGLGVLLLFSIRKCRT